MSAWIGDMNARTTGLIDSWGSRGIESSTETSEASSRIQWEGPGGAFDLQYFQRADVKSMNISSITDSGLPDMSMSASRVEQHFSFDSKFDFAEFSDVTDTTTIMQSTQSTFSAALTADTGFANVLAAFNATYSSTVDPMNAGGTPGVVEQSVEYDSVAETFEFSDVSGSFSISGESLREDMSSTVATSGGLLEMTKASTLSNSVAMNGDGFSLDYANQQSASISQMIDIAPTESGNAFSSISELNNASEQVSFASGEMKLGFTSTQSTQKTLTQFAPTDSLLSEPAMPSDVGYGTVPDLNLNLSHGTDSPINLTTIQSSFSTDFRLELGAPASFDIDPSPFATATETGGQFGATIQRPLELGISAPF